MPKDDWEKASRRERGRRALASGEYFRAGRKRPKKKKSRKLSKRKRRLIVTHDQFVVEYNGATPETSTLRIIKSGPLFQGLPPWPGFN